MRKGIALTLILGLCLAGAAAEPLPQTPPEAAQAVSADDTQARENAATPDIVAPPPAADEAGAPADIAPTAAPYILPTGEWRLDAQGAWGFRLDARAFLTQAQMETAERAGVSLEAGTLPAGLFLTPAQLYAIYPGAETLLFPPAYTITQRPFTDPSLTIPADEKIFYLTIDDTPSKTTPELLALLDTLGIKATFFLVGASARQYPEYTRAIYAAGHTLANHSFSHDADILSGSFAACLADFKRSQRLIGEALGFPIELPILRIPYGASTLPVSYRTKLQEEGYLWIDWNALNGDTESATDSDADVLRRAYATAGRYDGAIVMLVHDGKQRTLRTLEEMIHHFAREGYTFAVLQTNMERIPGVRMGFGR